MVVGKLQHGLAPERVSQFFMAMMMMMMAGAGARREGYADHRHRLGQRGVDPFHDGRAGERGAYSWGKLHGVNNKSRAVANVSYDSDGMTLGDKTSHYLGWYLGGLIDVCGCHAVDTQLQEENHTSSPRGISGGG